MLIAMLGICSQEELDEEEEEIEEEPSTIEGEELDLEPGETGKLFLPFPPISVRMQY
jgi:hypothetical protein